MEHDPFWEPKHVWYKGCVEQCCEYPRGSFGYVFWWSLRHELSMDERITFWAKDPERAMESWLEYFQFKWGQLAHHRKGRQ